MESSETVPDLLHAPHRPHQREVVRLPSASVSWLSTSSIEVWLSPFHCCHRRQPLRCPPPPPPPPPPHPHHHHHHHLHLLLHHHPLQSSSEGCCSSYRRPCLAELRAASTRHSSVGRTATPCNISLIVLVACLFAGAVLFARALLRRGLFVGSFQVVFHCGFYIWDSES